MEQSGNYISSCCETVMNNLDIVSRYCQNCHGYCSAIFILDESDEMNLEQDNWLNENPDLSDQPTLFKDDRGGTGHGDDSYSDADPGL